MATYSVRIELYGSPSSEVYTNLHSAMISKGFSRTFLDAVANKSFEFPHAMYGYFNQSTTANVVELAKSAAATIWKDFSVFVSSTEVRWEYYNLKSPK